MTVCEIPAWVRFDGLQSAWDVHVVKTAWRRGWLSLNPNAETAEDYLARTDRAKAARSYSKAKGLGNIHGTPIGMQK